MMNKNKQQTALIVGDFQAQHHHKAFLRKLLLFIATYQPDKIIINGDLVHLEKIFNTAAGKDDLNKSLADGRHVLESISAVATGQMFLIEGNHEAMLAKATAKDILKDIEGPDGTVQDIDKLLGCDKYGWKYITGYPDAKIWLTKYLAVQHGATARSKPGESVLEEMANTNYAVIVNHCHRQAIVTKTINTASGVKQLQGAETGCACNLDSRLQWTPNSHWAQGFIMATIWPSTAQHVLEPVSFRAGSLFYRDQRI